jgi:NADPH2:quinone reductase
MKAWVIHSKGVLEDLKLDIVTIPKPSDEQVRIKIHAVSLNPVDYKRCSFDESIGYPNIPGLDVSGVIDEIGKDVTSHSIGDVVYLHASLKNNCGFAEYLVSDAKYVVKTHILKPTTQQFLDLAALPTACWTAINAIEKLRLNKDIHTVMVTAGAGGVGGFTIQLLRNWSRTHTQKLTILTTCSSQNFDFVKKLGADYAIDYHKEDIKDSVKKILLELEGNMGLSAWIDCVGSESVDMAL